LPYHLGMALSPRLAALVAVVTFPLAVSIAPSPASASLVIALDLPTMVERSDHVAVVDVLSVKSDWDQKHERIMTTVELAVVESWKSAATGTNRLTIVQMGGTVGDQTMVVHGVSRFTPGERAVVFLRGTAARAGVVGMAQGKRVVRREIDTGRWMVQAPEKAGALFVRTAPATGTTPVVDLRAQPIEALRAEVKALIARPSQGR
jgi:hypothetical protein